MVISQYWPANGSLWYRVHVWPLNTVNILKYFNKSTYYVYCFIFRLQFSLLRCSTRNTILLCWQIYLWDTVEPCFFWSICYSWFAARLSTEAMTEGLGSYNYSLSWLVDSRPTKYHYNPVSNSLGSQSLQLCCDEC